MATVSNQQYKSTAAAPAYSPEEAAIQSIEEDVRASYLKAQQKAPGKARRFVHAKAHGLLRAEFQISPQAPEQLRVGLFKDQTKYPAWVRFSNGVPSVRHDLLPDVRGMAIKLLDPSDAEPSGSGSKPLGQDFVLSNYPVFFVRNAYDFAELAAKLSGPGLPSFFAGINPPRWRSHEISILFRSAFQWTPSVLDLQYWSQTPYRCGEKEVKYSARPLRRSKGPKFSLQANRLRNEMIERLKEEVVFEFCAQLRSHPDNMPIEDATITWSEQLAPFQQIALLRIPPQDFNSPERLALEEQLSFAPWHALPEHVPLGGINKIRKRLYETMANTRNALNT